MTRFTAELLTGTQPAADSVTESILTMIVTRPPEEAILPPITTASNTFNLGAGDPARLKQAEVKRWVVCLRGSY